MDTDILVVESSSKMFVPVYDSTQYRVLEEYSHDKKFLFMYINELEFVFYHVT